VIDPVSQRQAGKVLSRNAVGHGGLSLPAADLASQPIAENEQVDTGEPGGLWPEGANAVTVRPAERLLLFVANIQPN